MHGKLSCLVVFTSLVLYGQGYQPFQSKIPNGDKVPSPCDDNLWGGVGHLVPGGGGVRNSFGKAFGNGTSWTKDLCEADSDGDGKTNGEELGDPDCTWSEGDPAPGDVADLSHPGICEPTDSKECTELNDGLVLDGCSTYSGATQMRMLLSVLTLVLAFILLF